MTQRLNKNGDLALFRLINQSSKEQNKELNQQLKNLVERIKQLPPSSREQSKLLNQLLTLISKPGVLSSIETLMVRGVQVRRRGSNILQRVRLFCPKHLREEVYAEIKAETFNYIAKNINEYNPEKGTVTTWVNGILGVEYLKAHNNIVRNKVPVISLDAISHDFLAPSEEDNRLRELIEQDTSKLLNKPLNYTNRETQAKGRILLKEVLLMLLDGDKRQDMCKQFHISFQSLSSFIERNIEVDAINYLRENGFDFEPDQNNRIARKKQGRKKRKADDAEAA